MLTGIFHFSFTVDDIEQSKDFYGRIIGLELVHEMRHNHPYTSKQIGLEDADLLVAAYRIPGVEPQSSSHVLELIEYRNPKGIRIDVSTNNTGSAHLAFVTNDIFADYARMRAEGVEFRSEPVLIEAGVNKGGYTIYFRDCNGITLEMVQPRLPQ